MNRENQIDAGMALRDLMIQYLNELDEFKRVDIGSIANYYAELVGFESPNACLGFIKYLEGRGLRGPSLRQFTSSWITAYQEHLAHFYGIKKLRHTISVLENFWRWCGKNKFVRSQRPPARLRSFRLVQKYKIHREKNV